MRKNTILLCLFMAILYCHAQVPPSPPILPARSVNTNGPFVGLHRPNLYIPPRNPGMGHYVPPHTISSPAAFLKENNIKKISIYMYWAITPIPGDKDSALAATFEFNHNGDMTYSSNMENAPGSTTKKEYAYYKPHQLKQTIESTNGQTSKMISDYTYYNNDKEVYTSPKKRYNADSSQNGDVTRSDYDILGRLIAFYKKASPTAQLHVAIKYIYFPQTALLQREDNYAPSGQYESSTVYEYDSARNIMTTWKTWAQTDTTADAKVKLRVDSLNEHRAPVRSIIFGNPDKTILYTYNSDGTLYQTETFIREDRKELNRYYYEKY